MKNITIEIQYKVLTSGKEQITLIVNSDDPAALEQCKKNTAALSPLSTTMQSGTLLIKCSDPLNHHSYIEEILPTLCDNLSFNIKFVEIDSEYRHAAAYVHQVAKRSIKQ